MSSSNRKGLLKRLSMNLGGCGCGKSKPSDAIQPKPLLKPNCQSTSSSGDNCDFTSTTFSSNSSDEADLEIRPDPTCSKNKIGSSITVVKESTDPYRDFRDSMAQMVLEKEIYSRGGLEELLSRFLELNPPRHHASIVRAFTEIWNGVVLPEKERRKKAAAAVSFRKDSGEQLPRE